MVDTLDYTDIIINEAEALLALIGVEGTVSLKQEEEIYNLQIDVEETGILIGFHGETLSAIQLILSQIIFKKTGEWVHLSVNVGDYQERREEQLQSIADRCVAQALELGKSVTLPSLSAKERRVIHVYLKENEEITTESVGEGVERRLVVFPS
jgi:spoIIIJ-associated protein